MSFCYAINYIIIFAAPRGFLPLFCGFLGAVSGLLTYVTKTARFVSVAVLKKARFVSGWFLGGFLGTFTAFSHPENSHTARRGFLVYHRQITSRLQPFKAPFLSYPYIIPYKHKKPEKSPTYAPKRHIQARHPFRLYGSPGPRCRCGSHPEKSIYCGFKTPATIYCGFEKMRKFWGCVSFWGFSKADRLTGEVQEMDRKKFFKKSALVVDRTRYHNM